MGPLRSSVFEKRQPMYFFRSVHVLCPFCFEEDDYTFNRNNARCTHCGAKLILGEDF